MIFVLRLSAYTLIDIESYNHNWVKKVSKTLKNKQKPFREKSIKQLRRRVEAVSGFQVGY
jgi:hypothetical protein